MNLKATPRGSVLPHDRYVQAAWRPVAKRRVLWLLTSLQQAGVAFDASSAPLIALSQAAQSNPTGPAPASLGLPPGLTNLQALLLVTTVHADSPQLPTPTWATVRGDFQAGILTYSSLNELFGFNPLYTFFLPVTTFKDALCQLAGIETTYSSNLHSFRGDVLFYGSEFAFGPLGADNLALFSSAHSKQAINIPDRGELDIIFSRDRETLTDPVLLGFLSRVFH